MLTFLFGQSFQYKMLHFLNNIPPQMSIWKDKLISKLPNITNSSPFSETVNTATTHVSHYSSTRWILYNSECSSHDDCMGQFSHCDPLLKVCRCWKTWTFLPRSAFLDENSQLESESEERISHLIDQADHTQTFAQQYGQCIGPLCLSHSECNIFAWMNLKREFESVDEVKKYAPEDFNLFCDTLSFRCGCAPGYILINHHCIRYDYLDKEDSQADLISPDATSTLAPVPESESSTLLGCNSTCRVLAGLFLTFFILALFFGCWIVKKRKLYNNPSSDYYNSSTGFAPQLMHRVDNRQARLNHYDLQPPTFALDSFPSSEPSNAALLHQNRVFMRESSYVEPDSANDQPPSYSEVVNANESSKFAPNFQSFKLTSFAREVIEHGHQEQNDQISVKMSLSSSDCEESDEMLPKYDSIVESTQ